MQPFIAIIATFAALAVAQNVSTPSVNIFLPTPYENTVHFAASVLGACNGETTYGVRCTAGVLAPRFTCNPDTPQFTVTEASNLYKATKTSPISSAIMTITETCSLRGTHEASCTVDLVITGSGKVTSRSTSSIIAGTDLPSYYMYQMPVTGGADILKATGNVCVSSGATRNTALFGAMLGLFVFTAAIVL